jgi:hypothetical protein
MHGESELATYTRMLEVMLILNRVPRRSSHSHLESPYIYWYKDEWIVRVGE